MEAIEKSPELAVPTATVLGNGVDFPSASLCGLIEFLGDKQACSVVLLLDRDGSRVPLVLRTVSPSLVFGRHVDGE
jgi:hypothetical protein